MNKNFNLNSSNKTQKHEIQSELKGSDNIDKSSNLKDIGKFILLMLIL